MANDGFNQSLSEECEVIGVASSCGGNCDRCISHKTDQFFEPLKHSNHTDSW